MSRRVKGASSMPHCRHNRVTAVTTRHNHLTKHLTTPSKRGIIYKSVEESRDRTSYPVTTIHNCHNALDCLT